MHATDANKDLRASLAIPRTRRGASTGIRPWKRYDEGMAQSRVPARLQPLVEQLRLLAPPERSLVVRAANPFSPLPGVPASELRELIGIVNIGGNVVEDCEAIYDDV